MKPVLLTLVLTISLMGCSQAQEISSNLCSPLGYDKAQLMELRAAKFEIADDAKRNEFARGLVNCLGHPDSDLRDKVAYEGISNLLRSETVSDETVLDLREALVSILNAPDASGQGFVKPFAALVLSEVVRVDRKAPLFTPQQRVETVNAVSNYMIAITDYRGYDEVEGWRHGVAHTADILLQFSLNKKIEHKELVTIQNAIFNQLVPQDNHFYIYGEPGRLTRPVIYLAARDAFTEEEWAGWFAKIADPAPFETWRDVYSSQAGLSKLHNTRAFVNAVHVNAINSQNPKVKALADPALDVLQKLP